MYRGRYLNLIALISIFIISGCVTTKQISLEEEAERLKNRINVIEAELRQRHDENLQLKEKIAQLEKTPVKMPTGEDIQTALKNAGFYSGEIDGQIGSKTKEAIKKFQEANGLNPDGVIGSRTWEILTKYLQEKSE